MPEWGRSGTFIYARMRFRVFCEAEDMEAAIDLARAKFDEMPESMWDEFEVEYKKMAGKELYSKYGEEMV